MNLLVTALGGASQPTNTDEERAAAAALAEFNRTGNGYLVERSTHPQTIGYALLDSPVAMAAWMLDHDTDSYYRISRAFLGGPPAGNLTREHVLDNITLYWFIGRRVSAARSYWAAAMGRIAGGATLRLLTPRSTRRRDMRASEPHRTGRFRTLRRWPIVVVMTVAMLAGSVTVSQQARANTGLVAVPGDLTNFVIAGAPTWYFARANSRDACWPSPAFVGANNDQHPEAPLANWPDTNKGCAPTWSWFPTYYNVKTCYGTEVRVVYTIYFPKDGFYPRDLNGHAHDFEHVTVIWRYAGNNQWKRAVLVMGRHGSEYPKKWSNVETLTIQDNEGTYGHDGDFPQAYVGFAKHQMFNDKTGFDKTVTGGLSPDEYRSSDYRYTPRNFVPVTDTNYWGQKFLQYDWGKASSNPAKMYQDICNTRWSDLGY